MLSWPSLNIHDGMVPVIQQGEESSSHTSSDTHEASKGFTRNTMQNELRMKVNVFLQAIGAFKNDTFTPTQIIVMTSHDLASQKVVNCKWNSWLFQEKNRWMIWDRLAHNYFPYDLINLVEAVRHADEFCFLRHWPRGSVDKFQVWAVDAKSIKEPELHGTHTYW